MQVKNIKGTSKRNCVCDSWLQHWEKYNENKYTAKWCFATGCHNAAELGAHVYMAPLNRLGGSVEYIVPFCSQHNQVDPDVGIEIDTDSLMDLAPANQSETCG